MADRDALQMAEIEKFHHYEVLRRDDGSLYELGRGAMGITYKAFDTNLRCTVALKVINGTYLNSEVARQRFVREARAAARLSHPNVAAVFHLGEDVNSYFYAMEFIAGETVEARVKRVGPLPAVAALDITLQVAKALRAAEREGLVHRDIKPANLMLISDEDVGDTFVKVIDFGLAKSAVKEAGDATVTIAGFVGTPHFASPEQLEEHELDVRSDIYSLGVTLWWMLTGKPPFSGALAGIMRDHLQKPPPVEMLAGQPPEVITLLKRMLEKDPGKRPQNATELRREIEAVLKTVVAADEYATKVAGTEEEGPDVFATQALAGAAAPTVATVAPSTMSSAPAPTVGVVLSRRYRLLRDCGDRPTGRMFQALDLDHNRLVALKVVHSAMLATPEATQRVERQVSAAQSASHPGLIAVHSFERTPEGHAVLVSEWVNGFSLLDMLRGRSRLPANEVLRIIEPLAAASDFAAQNKLDSLELALDQVLLNFETEYEVGSQPDFLPSPMAEWPTFSPKLSVINLTAGNEPATFQPEVTMVPASGGGGSGPADVTDFPRRLAMICFELLSGSPPPSTRTPGPVRIAPLPSLTEDGNNVLRRALGVGGFGTSTDFVRALKTGSGGATTVAPSVRAAVAPVAAPPTAAPPTVIPPTVVPPTLVPASAAPTSPPPVAPLTKAAAAPGGSKPPLIPILIGAGVIVLGGLAYYVVILKKTVEPLNVTPTPVVAMATPVPAPTSAPTPQPTRVVIAPTPAPTTVPQFSRHDQFLKALEVARRVDSSMPVDQLNAYLKLAQEFPEEDDGLSRLDSVIAVMVDEAKTPEAKARRYQQIQNQLEQAANLGSESALMFIANQMLPVDPGLALTYFRRAAEKGNTTAMVKVGNLLSRGAPGLPPRPAEGARWFKAASDKGNAQGKLNLAEVYHEGLGGVPRDLAQSTKLLQEAYELAPNDPAVLATLALVYERGEAVPVDTRKAVDLMSRAAEAGNPFAMGNLGTYYMKGYVTGRQDAVKAAQSFKQGADLDNAMSMFFYAQCLRGGLGVAKNEAEARNYYRASAERGFPPAIEWCRENRVPFTPR